MDDINSSVNILKKLPLYHIMKGNRELFYSNLLAWFFYDEEIKPIFIKTLSQLLESLGYPKESISKFENSDVMLRENNHLDCVFKYSYYEKKRNGKSKKKIINTLVIENKVKDYPTFYQLDKYSNKINKANKGEDCIKIVLSFDYQNTKIHDEWENIYYKLFAEVFSKKIKDCSISENKKSLIDQYCYIINFLSHIIENQNNIVPSSLDSEIWKDIYSMLAKQRYSSWFNEFVSRIETKVPKENIVYTPKEYNESEYGKKIFITCQYATYTGGMIEGKIKLYENLEFIIEIQDKGIAIGFVNSNEGSSEIKEMNKGNDKTERQREYFYETVNSLKGDYKDLKDTLFKDKIDESYTKGSEKNNSLHGYNNMVYYLEERNIRNNEDLEKSIDEMIDLLRTVYEMKK